MNHLVWVSEIVSDILDPIVEEYIGGREIISTEDGIARLELVNEGNVGWSKNSFWRDMVEGEYKACSICAGVDGYVWDDECPELCTCEDMDGVDEEGRILVSMGAMRSLRRKRWEVLIGWDEADPSMRISAEQALPEDIQDFSSPMVIIGTDVVNLYPSLDIGEVVKIVGEAVKETVVRFEEVDYLEAARYVALCWTEEECMKSELRRILPRRRYNTGTRPGLTGAGPLGATRGDQEQWIFPRVRLRANEKRLLVATVLQLAPQAMFTHHYYGFNGMKFRQGEGGPIGLRGT